MRRGPFGPSVGLGICCQLAEYGVKLLCSLLLAQLLTQVMDGTLSPVYPWAAGSLLLLVVSVGPLFLLRRAYERAVGRDGQRFRETLYAGILSRELEVASRGELEVKLRRDTQAILKFVQRSCPQAVGGTVIWVGSALLLCHTDGRVGLLFFALNLVQLLPIFVYETWTKRIHNETCQAEEADSAWLVEGYHGAHVLKSYGAQGWYLACFCKLEQAVMRWGYRAEGAVTVEDVVFKGIDSLLNYGSYVILGLFVLYGGLSAAKLPLLVLLAGTLFSSVNAVFTWWLERAEYQAACQRLHWMQREDRGETPEKPMLMSCTGVEKAFGDKRILSGISLDILRGEHVLLQGKNGAGKSTLLRILLGLERADAGIVLRCSDLAYALQEEAQTTLTVRELTEQLEKTPGMDSKALHRHLVGFQLMGYMDQPLAQLSGGQQKRFFLAAALAKDSQLLVLDEPTNHLDRESVAYLTQVLQEYSGALFLCSHTAWTALRWDKILHMQGGIICEG